MSKCNTETGASKEKAEFLEMELFEKPGSPLTPHARRGTFEPSYAGSIDADTPRFIALFDEAEANREKADNIIEESRKKASLIESEAYEKGFAQGEKDGLEMGAKKVEKILDRIHGILEDMVVHRQEFIRRCEKEILHLICTIAEKVVRGAVHVDSEIVRRAILDALTVAADRTEVTVRVNPEEVEYVKETRPEFFDRISNLKSITIESDPTIARGGCFMETAFGNVDARVETQLEQIANAIERVFEKEGVEFVTRESG